MWISAFLLTNSNEKYILYCFELSSQASGLDMGQKDGATRNDKGGAVLSLNYRSLKP